MTLWFLTRSFYPFQKGGGPQIRAAEAIELKKVGWNVVVVMPSYGIKEITFDNNIIQIPMYGNSRLLYMLEKFGFLEDYLDFWIKNAYTYLVDKIKKNDIIFATTGGELGMIKLGAKLKQKLNSKFVINFHDPIDYTLVNNIRISNSFHTSREKSEYKYISCADLLITSSKSYKEALCLKYPSLSYKIKNIYFGYIKEISFSQKSANKMSINIAYVGAMSEAQRPEILYEAYKKTKNCGVNIYFIGNYTNYAPFKNICDKNIHFIEFMPHDDFIKFISKNIDIGFVSLYGDYFSVCVPSKIYEYINLALPIIGALPYGDAMDIINNNSYGLACKYDDTNTLSKIILDFTNSNILNKFKTNIIKDRIKWSMENFAFGLDKALKDMINES